MADANVAEVKTEENPPSQTQVSSTPKSRKQFSPALICTLLTILAIIGLIWGYSTKSPLIIAIFLLPVVAYEIYRTKGESTTLSSWILLAILAAEIILILFKVNYNIGQWLDQDYIYIGGQAITLGDVKTIGPALLAIFSVILFVRTAGPYTKWLSVIIFVSAFVMIYVISPESFKDLLRASVGRIGWYF
jgi:hypothetical protein